MRGFSSVPRPSATPASTSSMNESNVPDSSPGAVITSEASGYGAWEPPSPDAANSAASASASDQLSNPTDSEPSNAYRSPRSRHESASLLIAVSTDRPSMATLISIGSTPFARA